MLFRLLSLALWVGAAAPGAAQSVSDIGGPANPPAAGFRGQQFVDNRGCVYMRAGYDGQTNWVPRVTFDRKAMCGYPPTFGPQPVTEVADQAPAIAETAPAKAKPYAKRPPVAADVMPAPVAKVGCYTSAPVAQRVRLTSGGTAIVCTRGDGTMDGWRPPVFAAGAPVGAALLDGQMAGGQIVGRTDGAVGLRQVVQVEPVPPPPEGFLLAWKDDRLNPYRGLGTAQGWADQDQVWTRQVPAQLIKPGRTAPRRIVQPRLLLVETPRVETSPTVTYAAKNAPPAPAAQSRVALYVQVGSYGQPGNAQSAANRIGAAGLPVTGQNATLRGQTVRVVLAGPFDSRDQAQAALGTMRAAGFADAFIR
jgi:cell division septation protein DedD